MMSKILIRRMVVAGCMVFLSFFTACSSPRVTVDNALFDGGDVPQGKKIIHAFMLKNTGDGILTIKIKRC